MKIVLRKDLENLGEIDDVVKVAGGYARNFLLPKKLAVLATKSELAAVEKRSAEKEKRQAAKKADAEQLAQKLADLELKVLVDASPEGKLFGSVTAQDIADAVKDASGIELPRKKIHLKESIKSLGEYVVPIKLYKEVATEVKVVVEKKESEKAEKKEEKTTEPADSEPKIAEEIEEKSA